MATQTVILPVNGGRLLSGTATTVAEFGSVHKILLDDSDTHGLEWRFNLPQDYVGSPVLKFTFSMASATTNDVYMQSRINAITPNTEAEPGSADSYNNSAITVAGTGGYTKQGSITLTSNDSMSANDYVQLELRRNGGDASDTATGDMELLDAKLEYSDV